jgi:hypothetical protein
MLRVLLKDVLLAEAVNIAADVSDQRAAYFEVGYSTNEDYQDKWAPGVNDSGVVVNFGEVVGFVGHARTGGDAFFEGLALEDFAHLAGGVGIDGFAVAMASSRTARPRAVVVLFRPFWYALLSSTPRRTFIPSA